MTDLPKLTAEPVPFSSTVGASIMLTAPDGRCVAILAIRVPDVSLPFHDTSEAVQRAVVAAINAAPHVPAPAQLETEGPWQWWAGRRGCEMFNTGPCDTRDQVIAEAVQDGFGEFEDTAEDGAKVFRNAFQICEARNDPIRLSDWIDADDILERAEDSIANSDRVSSEFDDEVIFEATTEQKQDLKARIERACDEWQLAHGLRFSAMTFSHQRNEEDVVTDALREIPKEGGAA